MTGRLFSPTADPHEGTRVRGWLELPLTVETPQQRGSPAVSFARSAAAVESPFVVRVQMRVDEGLVELVLERTSGVEDTVTVSPASEIAHVELTAVRPDGITRLVVRNASDAGASRAVLLAVTCLPLAQPADTAPRPAYSEPVASPAWNHYFGDAGFTAVERLRAMRFAAMQEPSVLDWSDGLSFQLAPGDQSSRALYISSTYEPTTLCVLRTLLSSGDVFMDIGANAGLMLLAASRWVGVEGRIYAFEPSAREYARLTDTITRNRLTQVTAVRSALGREKRSATLRVADGVHGGLNTFGDTFPYSGIATERMEQVDVQTLDEFVATHHVPRIAAIKIDVEGSETDVLLGARHVLERDRPALVVEVLGRALQASGSSSEQLEQLLRSAGYTLHAINDDASLRTLDSLADADGENIVALSR